MARKLKSPIKKFNEGLSEEQLETKRLIDTHTLTIINGKAGTGKTFLAMCYALERMAWTKLKQAEYEKIVVTRATVARKDHNNGFLPGDIDEKFEPWLQPIYDSFLKFESKETLDAWKKGGLLDIVPLMYLQGRTFTNSIIIVDEAQNLNDFEIEMLFTRIGKGSKMILCGDLRQQIVEGKSGLKALLSIEKQSERVCKHTLTENFRDPIVEELLLLYEKYVWNERGIKS
jgi:phosphate starvation-inducible PhoH-like protein